MSLQVAGDARSFAARLVWIDLERPLDHLIHRLGIVVLEERAAQERHVIRSGLAYVEAALGHVSAVPGWQQQVLAAESAVGPWKAEIRDPVPPHVVDDAEGVRRSFDDERPFAQVQIRPHVVGVGIGREEKALGIHQPRGHEHLVVVDAGGSESLQQRQLIHGGIAIDERRDGVDVVQFIEQLLRGGGIRHAVREIERAQARFHTVGRGDAGREGWRCGVFVVAMRYCLLSPVIVSVVS